MSDQSATSLCAAIEELSNYAILEIKCDSRELDEKPWEISCRPFSPHLQICFFYGDSLGEVVGKAIDSLRLLVKNIRHGQGWGDDYDFSCNDYCASGHSINRPKDKS